MRTKTGRLTLLTNIQVDSDPESHVRSGLYNNNLLFTTGVNFINIFRAAFTRADSKIAKKDSQVKQLFRAFGICKSCS